MAAESHGFDLVPAVALLGAGVDRRSDLQAAGSRLGARLPRRRHCHRSVRDRPLHRSGVDPQRRGARRGDAPLHHRARAQAVTAMGAPARDFRPRPGAGRRLRRPYHRRRGARSVLRRGLRLSPRSALPSPRRQSSCRSSRSAGRYPSRTARRSSPSCSSRISPSFRPLPSSLSCRRCRRRHPA